MQALARALETIVMPWSIFKIALNAYEIWRIINILPPDRIVAERVAAAHRYCRALRRLDGRTLLVKLLRQGLMSRPPRRV